MTFDEEREELQKLVGKRFRTLVKDSEEDDDYGEVEHLPGQEFIAEEVGSDLRQPMMIVAWQGQSVQKSTRWAVPAKGQWTLWTLEELRVQAQEVQGTGNSRKG